MEQIVKRFLAVMRQEKEIYDELAELSDQKQPAILQKDIRDLDFIVRKEQGAVLRLSQLEKQRIECVEAFAGERGIRPDSMSMKQIAELSPPPYSKELQKLNEELFALIQKLSAQNKTHRSLLEGRLDYVRFATDYLAAEQNHGAYSQTGLDGSPNRDASLTLIDRKV